MRFLKEKAQWLASFLILAAGLSFNPKKAHAMDKNEAAIAQLFDLTHQNLRSIEKLSSQMAELQDKQKELLTNQEGLNKNQAVLNENQYDAIQRVEALEDPNGSSSSDSPSATPSMVKRFSVRILRKNITWAVEEVSTKFTTILFRSIFRGS